MDKAARKRLVAFHEAGHAVLGLGAGLHPTEVVIKECSCGEPRCGWTGHTDYEERGREVPRDHDALQAMLMVCAAGRGAMEVEAGTREVDAGDSADQEAAFGLSVNLVPHLGPDATAEAFATAPRRAVEALRDPQVWRLVEKLAAALEVGDRLDRSDLRRLTDGHPGVEAAKAAVRRAMPAAPAMRRAA
ncbi:MAG TPA: hypothetical protein VF841_17330 [Anaeromyxobacter sp.]